MKVGRFNSFSIEDCRMKHTNLELQSLTMWLTISTASLLKVLQSSGPLSHAKFITY